MLNIKKSKAIPIILAAFVIVLLALFMMSLVIRILYPLAYKDIIFQVSVENKLEPALVAAIIKTESNFRPGAESKVGAKGLMQITTPTGRWIASKLNIQDYREDMLFEPAVNIQFGCWYLRYLHNYYDGNWGLAIAAYNGGHGNVDKWLKDKNISNDGKNLHNIPFRETRHYVNKIKINHTMYKKIYNWGDNKEDIVKRLFQWNY